MTTTTAIESFAPANYCLHPTQPFHRPLASRCPVRNNILHFGLNFKSNFFLFRSNFPAFARLLFVLIDFLWIPRSYRSKRSMKQGHFLTIVSILLLLMMTMTSTKHQPPPSYDNFHLSTAMLSNSGLVNYLINNGRVGKYANFSPVPRINRPLFFKPNNRKTTTEIADLKIVPPPRGWTKIQNA